MAYDIEKDWTTKAGLRAIVVVGKSGERRTHRCGYVQVPEGHPLHGVGYSDPMTAIPKEVVDNAKIGKKGALLALTAGVNALEGENIRRSPDVVFDCHGGLTYSGGDGYPAEEGWWFGFDCHHAGDGEIEPDPRWSAWRDGVVRELDYVSDECESLASQIVAMFPPKQEASDVHP